MTAFSVALKNARTIKGHTLRQAGATIECAHESLRKWETTDQHPRIDHLPHLAKYLGITVEFLVVLILTKTEDYPTTQNNV